MGDWTIVVTGTGAHHNTNYPTDADRMAQRFVDELIEAGHTVRSATFTSGGETRLDTLEAALAKHAASAYYEDPEKRAGLVEAFAEKRRGLSVNDLAPSPRREPLPASVDPVEPTV